MKLVLSVFLQNQQMCTRFSFQELFFRPWPLSALDENVKGALLLLAGDVLTGAAEADHYAGNTRCPARGRERLERCVAPEWTNGAGLAEVSRGLAHVTDAERKGRGVAPRNKRWQVGDEHRGDTRAEVRPAPGFPIIHCSAGRLREDHFDPAAELTTPSQLLIPQKSITRNPEKPSSPAGSCSQDESKDTKMHNSKEEPPPRGQMRSQVQPPHSQGQVFSGRLESFHSKMTFFGLLDWKRMWAYTRRAHTERGRTHGCTAVAALFVLRKQSPIITSVLPPALHNREQGTKTAIFDIV